MTEPTADNRREKLWEMQRDRARELRRRDPELTKRDIAKRMGVREQSVAKLGPRDVVGEMSLFTGDRRTATVSAVTNVDAVEITKWSLERVFARAPELIDKFASVLARRQAELNAVAGSRSADSGENFARQARKVFAGIFGRGS